MTKRALIYGIAAAAGVALWSMIEYWLGFHTTRADVGRYTGFIGTIFPLLGIVLAIRAARTAHGGALSFGDGFRQGLGVTLVVALLGAVTIWLYFTVVNPGFLASAAAQGTPGTAGGQALLVLVSSLVMGLIISAIAAAALRRRLPAAI